MLHDRQQLDVREAEVERVVGELLRELAVGERAVVLERVAPPRAEVHLVDRHRLAVGLSRAAAREPLVVAPAVLGHVDDRRGLRRHLRRERERVRLQLDRAVRLDDLELVALPRLGALDDGLPDAGVAEVRIGLGCQSLKSPTTRDRARVRRPDGERDAVVAHVRAEHVVQPLVPSLAREVEVDLAEDAHTAARSSSRDDARDRDRDPVGRLSSS